MTWVDLIHWWAYRPWKRRPPRIDLAIANFPLPPEPHRQPKPRREAGPYRDQGPGCVVFEER